MAVFRIEKTRDYTVMSNHHLKNKNLTLKAKGLLSVMLSLPETWDYTLKGLAIINREGVDAIREAVRELEKVGYIVRTRVRNAKGQLTSAEYVIYEQPQAPQIDESEQPVSDQPTLEKPALENPILDNPALENPAQENPVLGNPALENPTQLNTHRENTHPEKMHPFIPNGGNPYPSNPYPSMRTLRESVKAQIGYDAMSEEYGKDRLDEIISLMVEIRCTTSPTLFISGEEYPVELVHERFRQINSLHIQYMFECLRNNASSIRNIKAYMLAVLFNAPSTLSAYYDAQVRHDRAY